MEDFLKDIMPLESKEEYKCYIPSNYDRIWGLLYDGDFNEKLPRKLKKQILGTRINRSKLRNRSRKLVKEFIRLDNACIDVSVDDYDLFCPKCGFTHYNSDYCSDGVDSSSSSHCLKCGTYIGGHDNSPWYSVFQEMELKDC